MLQPPERRDSSLHTASPNTPSEPQKSVQHKGFSIRKLLSSLKYIHKKSFWKALFSLSMPSRKVTTVTVEPQLTINKPPAAPKPLEEPEVKTQQALVIKLQEEPEVKSQEEPKIKHQEESGTKPEGTPEANEDVFEDAPEPDALMESRLEQKEQLQNLVDALCQENTHDVMKALFRYRKGITSEFTILNKELCSEDFSRKSTVELHPEKIPDALFQTLKTKTRYIQELSISLRSIPGLTNEKDEALVSALSHTASGCTLSSRFILDRLLQITLGKDAAEQLEPVPPNEALTMKCFETLKNLKTEVEKASSGYVAAIAAGDAKATRKFCMRWYLATRSHCQNHDLPDTPDSIINQMVSPTRYMTIPEQVEDALWNQSRSGDQKIPRLFASMQKLHEELPDGSREQRFARAAIMVNDTLCKRMEVAKTSEELVANTKAKPDQDMLVLLRGGLN